MKVYPLTSDEMDGEVCFNPNPAADDWLVRRRPGLFLLQKEDGKLMAWSVRDWVEVT